MTIPTTMITKVPLPPGRECLAQAHGPQMLGSAEVAELLEFWGFTRSGVDYLKKLEGSGVIRPVRLAHSRCKRWVTVEVLAIYQQEVQS